MCLKLFKNIEIFRIINIADSTFLCIYKQIQKYFKDLGDFNALLNTFKHKMFNVGILWKEYAIETLEKEYVCKKKELINAFD